MSSFVRIIFDSYEVIYVMVFKGERVQSKVGQKSWPKSFLLSILCCLLFDNSEGFAFLYEIILQIYHKPQLFKHTAHCPIFSEVVWLAFQLKMFCIV
jgi:hypothetical protein